MLHHAALTGLIAGLTILGFGGVIAVAGRLPKRKYGRHRKNEREPGDAPQTI